MKDTFGEFVSRKRQEQNISLRKFAGIVKISPEYLSKIENNERPSPSTDILIRISEKLYLSETEKELLFDLAAQSKPTPTIAIDLINYIKKYPTIHQALRMAKRCDANNNDWEKFINILAEKDL